MFVNFVSDLVIKRVISANRLLSPPINVTTIRKDRECWAVVLKIRGKTIYTNNDKTFVSDSFHPVVLPKGSNYSWKCVEPGECLIIEFDAVAADTDLFSFDVKDNGFFLNNFLKIEKSIIAKKPYFAIECNYFLHEIILSLLKSKNFQRSHPQKIDLLKPAANYITTNYFNSAITNTHLANLCQMSTVYFRKCFTTTYGVSPIKYLHDFRIEKAKAILHSDFESIEQVALSVGYNSIYHFSKMFKLYTGKSPLEYSKQK